MPLSRFAVLFALGGAGVFGCSGENQPNDEGGGDGSTNGVATCLDVCERARECPNAAPLHCSESCAEFASDPCPNEAALALTCLAAADVCDPLPPECVEELDRYYVCLDSVDTGGCAPDTAPSSASCSSICAGGPYSCFADEAACVTSCSNGSARSEMVGCASEYQTMIACISTCNDICALTVDDCVDPRSAFLACDAAYCSANPDSDPCRIETN